MKKILFTAAMAVSGLVMVSCEADAIDNAIPQAKNFRAQKTGVIFNGSYTVPLSNTSTPMATTGPGDEIIKQHHQKSHSKMY